MTPQMVTMLPFGYDDKTEIGLTGGNEIIIIHPVMPPMMYDETVMRWVHVEHAKSKEPK